MFAYSKKFGNHQTRSLLDLIIKNSKRATLPSTDRTVLIVTALSVEYLAVRAGLTEIESVTHRDGTRIEFGTLGNTEWRVALVQLGPGVINAAATTMQAIAWVEPEIMLFAGVAGSLKSDISIGDVVVGTKIYGIHGGKASAEGFSVRPEVWQASYKLLQAAMAALREDLNVHYKPIASGDVVIAGEESELREFLRGHYNDACAIEMEGSGAAHAAHVAADLPTLVVRGISDLADAEKAQHDARGTQKDASERAAHAIFEILKVLSTDNKPQVQSGVRPAGQWLACVIEWAAGMPPNGEADLDHLVRDAVQECLQDSEAVHQSRGWSGEILVSIAVDSSSSQLAYERLLETLDTAAARLFPDLLDLSRPILWVSAHRGAGQLHGESFNGEVLTELNAYRQSPILKDALSGRSALVATICSDEVFESRTPHVTREREIGSWASLDVVAQVRPRRMWLRMKTRLETHKQAVLVGVAVGSSTDLPESAIRSQINFLVQEVCANASESGAAYDLELRTWGRIGFAIVATNAHPESVLIGHIIPRLARSLAVRNMAEDGTLRIFLGVHSGSRKGQVCEDDVIVADRLMRTLLQSAGGWRQRSDPTLCLISTAARSADPGCFEDFIDPSNYVQVPAEGYEEQLDSWIYVPYSPRMSGS
ncbi:phosphorylase family protein [Streptomyces subrutilus]|uniref:5'-methylthioadenosine/S-adenosylhomocysteine nucleosidase family protein n=1 Tax=Streptomyces subrutilus TaxID=36818 RepID=UPI0033D64418